jgi:hypothetical protein
MRGKKLKNKSEEKIFWEKYQSIYEEMLTYRFLGFMNFLSDILFDISKPYLLFQDDNIEFNELFCDLEICLENILKN